MKIAYISNSFGTLSHTFIRREVSELPKLGLDISLFGIRPDIADELTKEEKKLAEEADHLYPLDVLYILYANLYFMFTRPSFYFKTFTRAFSNEEKNILHYLKLIYHFFISSYSAKKMEKLKIKHVHAHFTNVSSSIAMYSAGLLGIGYSITLHSAGEKGLPSVIGIKQKLRDAKFLCSISEYNIKYFNNVFPCRDKTFLVRCGIDPYIYIDKSLRESFKDNIIRLISIGRFEEKKGFIYLVEACSYLKNQGINFHLSMIGDGPLLGNIKYKAGEYSLMDNIEFLGSAPQVLIRKELGKSDICIVPSVKSRSGEEEGIPVVIMEAMAMGVPVIATRHSGIPEIVKNKETGILVPEKDPEAIAKAINLLYQDAYLYNTCVDNARRNIIENFDIRKIAVQKMEIFRNNI